MKLHALSIRPELIGHADGAQLSCDTWRVWLYLWAMADRKRRVFAAPADVAITVWRTFERADAVRAAIAELAAVGMLRRVTDYVLLAPVLNDAHTRQLVRRDDGKWSRAAYPEVYRRDGRACRYCGGAERLSIDHVIPRSQGGHDHQDNMVVACRTCNSRKNGRTPEQAGMVLREVLG